MIGVVNPEDPELAAIVRIAEILEELKLTQNEQWLTALKMCVGMAVSSGMTLEETQKRVAKLFAVYARQLPNVLNRGQA